MIRPDKADDPHYLRTREVMKRHYRCPRSEFHRHAFRTIGGEIMCPDCQHTISEVEVDDETE